MWWTMTIYFFLLQHIHLLSVFLWVISFVQILKDAQPPHSKQQQSNNQNEDQIM